MRIARSRLHPSVTEQPADDRQALAERERPRGEGVARIVDVLLVEAGGRSHRRQGLKLLESRRTRRVAEVFVAEIRRKNAAAWLCWAQSHPRRRAPCRGLRVHSDCGTRITEHLRNAGKIEVAARIANTNPHSAL